MKMRNSNFGLLRLNKIWLDQRYDWSRIDCSAREEWMDRVALHSDSGWMVRPWVQTISNHIPKWRYLSFWWSKFHGKTCGTILMIWSEWWGLQGHLISVPLSSKECNLMGIWNLSLRFLWVEHVCVCSVSSVVNRHMIYVPHTQS